MEKLHPKRDFFKKKIVVPTAITTVGIAAASMTIAASNLISGSTVMGFLPVYSNPVLTVVTTGVVGAGLGLVLTPAIIITKNALTKAHYKRKYKTASGNLSDYLSGLEFENLPISTLMSKMEKTENKIKELDAKRNPFAKIHKYFLNKVNRNRQHHVEKTFLEFQKMNKNIDCRLEIANEDNDSSAIETLTARKNAINDFRFNIANFLESNGRLDINSNLVNAVRAQANGATNKQIKKVRNDIARKQQTGAEIEREGLVRLLIPELTERIAARNAAREAAQNLLVDEVVRTQIGPDGSVTVTGKNGATETFVKGVDPAKEIKCVKHGKKKGERIVVYSDDTEKTIRPPREPKPLKDTKSSDTSHADAILAAAEEFKIIFDQFKPGSRKHKITQQTLERKDKNGNTKRFNVREENVAGLITKLTKYIADGKGKIEDFEKSLPSNQKYLFRELEARHVREAKENAEAAVSTPAETGATV